MIPFLFSQFFSNEGLPLNGGYIQFYEAGTTTPKPVYQTSTGNIFHTNPVKLLSSGRPEGSGNIWLGEGAYKAVLFDSNMVQLCPPADNIPGASGTTNQSIIIVETYNDLRNIVDTVSTVFVQGRSSIGDGGEGIFFFDPTSTVGDNDSTILAPSNSVFGRYVRVFESFINPLWSGIQYNSIAGQNTLFTNCQAVANYHKLPILVTGQIYFNSNYNITESVTFTENGKFCATSNITVTFKEGSWVESNTQIVNEFVQPYFEDKVATSIKASWFDDIHKATTSTIKQYDLVIDTDIVLSTDLLFPDNLRVIFTTGIISTTTTIDLRIQNIECSEQSQIIDSTNGFSNLIIAKDLTPENFGYIVNGDNTKVISSWILNGKCKLISNIVWTESLSLLNTEASISGKGTITINSSNTLKSLTLKDISITFGVGGSISLTGDLTTDSITVTSILNNSNIIAVSGNGYLKDSYFKLRSQIVVNGSVSIADNCVFEDNGYRGSFCLSRITKMDGCTVTGFKGLNGTLLGSISNSSLEFVGQLNVSGDCIIENSSITALFADIPMIQMGFNASLILRGNNITNAASGPNPFIISTSSNTILFESDNITNYGNLTNGFGTVINNSGYFFQETTVKNNTINEYLPIDSNIGKQLITSSTTNWGNKPGTMTSNGSELVVNSTTAFNMYYTLNNDVGRMLKCFGGIIEMTVVGNSDIVLKIYDNKTASIVCESTSPLYTTNQTYKTTMQRYFGLNDWYNNSVWDENNLEIRLYGNNLTIGTTIKVEYIPAVPANKTCLELFWQNSPNLINYYTRLKDVQSRDIGGGRIVPDISVEFDCYEPLEGWGQNKNFGPDLNIHVLDSMLNNVQFDSLHLSPFFQTQDVTRPGIPFQFRYMGNSSRKAVWMYLPESH